MVRFDIHKCKHLKFYFGCGFLLQYIHTLKIIIRQTQSYLSHPLSSLPLSSLPLQIVQLYTYQKAFMTKFSTVSARLDIELLTSQQRMREVRLSILENQQPIVGEKM